MLSGAYIDDGDGLIEKSHLIKFTHKIAHFRDASSISGPAMQSGIQAVGSGAPEVEIASAFHSQLGISRPESTGLPAFITSGETARSFYTPHGLTE